MVMMRHASTHRLLLAREKTLIRRVYASANDCQWPVTVNTEAEREGRQPLRGGSMPFRVELDFRPDAA